jgi:hypothetical protein
MNFHTCFYIKRIMLFLYLISMCTFLKLFMIFRVLCDFLVFFVVKLYKPQRAQSFAQSSQSSIDKIFYSFFDPKIIFLIGRMELAWRIFIRVCVKWIMLVSSQSFFKFSKELFLIKFCEKLKWYCINNKFNKIKNLLI